MLNKELNSTNTTIEDIKQKRLTSILNWIEKHGHLILQTDSVKLELNIKGASVKGTITQFPLE